MEEPYRTILQVVFILIYPLVYVYLQQRAKNQADLAVKEKLTSIEEGIKTVNALQIDRGKQIFSEEKDSIIVFFAQLNTWIWESLNNNISDYTILNFEDIPKRLINMQDAYNKTNVAYSKVMLITNDPDLIKTGHIAIYNTHKVHLLRVDVLNRLCKSLKEQNRYEHILKKFDYGSEDNPNNDHFTYSDASHWEYTFQQKIANKHNIESKDLFKTAMESINTFKDSAQIYLRKENPTK